MLLRQLSHFYNGRTTDEFMREVEETTQGSVKMGPGTLYGTIKRLLAAGLIEESDERPDPEMDSERRRYYQLTAEGKRVAREEAQRYARTVQTARLKGLLHVAVSQN